MSGYELWKSDGTEAGTVRVKDISRGSASAGPSRLTNVGGTLYFNANDGVSGFELWKSDGTEAGTVQVRDLRIGPDWSNPRFLTNVGGTLYFHANDGVSGVELWMSDGTEAGTMRVKDIRPGVGGAFSPYYNSRTNVGGTLYFSANDGATGFELWKSDGTEAGTIRVKDLLPGSSIYGPRNLTNVGGTLYFSANDAASGFELWKSDGTQAGTVRVKDISLGSASAGPSRLTNVVGTLYFNANDGVSGFELWKSDGTAAGTIRVKDINAGTGFSAPIYLTNVGGTLYFQANDGVSGYELWKSDGTDTGTVRVKDILPGASGASPSLLTNVGGTLYFRANDSVNGDELWKSDGTAAGTVPVRLPGNLPLVNPTEIAFAGDRLFVAGSRPEVGAELFTLDLSEPLLGDYDRSGVVNDLDRAFWAANYGATTGLGLQADGNGDGVVDAADYTVWRDNLGAFRDDHGSDPSLSTSVAVPSSTSGVVSTVADADWFRLSVTAGIIHRASLTLGTLSAATVRVLAADGVTEVASGMGSLDWTPSATGNYYVEVTGTAGATGSYTLGLARDDHDDTAATATVVSVPSTTSARVFNASDADWFRLSATAGVAHRVTLTLGTLSAATVRVLAADGVTEVANGVGPLDLRPTVTGDYYVEVTGTAGAAGSYTLGLARDDHGDSSADATVVSVPSTTSANIFNAADTDWFRFPLAASSTLTLSATAGAGASLALRLLVADGVTVLASDLDGGSASISYPVTVSGNYYAEVTGVGGTTGTYTLLVNAAVPDDHGNNAGSATAISVPSTSSGAISPSGDADYFSFAAIAGTQYRFETLGGGTLADTTLTLYGSDGATQLLFDDDGGPSTLSLINWTAPASGTYYVAMRGYNANIGTYTLSVTTVGASASLATAPLGAPLWESSLQLAFASLAQEESETATEKARSRGQRVRYTPTVRG